MAQRLEVTANKMEVYPDGNGGFKIDMRVSRDEYRRVLGNYGYDEIVDYCGTSNLLDAMDSDKIVEFLRENGYKVEKEE